uniref:CUB domain-containing protein n=1 Tax=Homalodisca liturata TaxID=320908 RepID=A0A1B6J6L8_9HEMI
MIYNKFVFFHVICTLQLASSSDSSRTYTLESDKVCSQSPKFILKRLPTGSDSLTVRETNYFDNWSGKYSFNCRFEIETGYKSQFPGLFIVIQKLLLRKNHNTGECIDYVRIRPVNKDVLSEISHINFNFKRKYPWHYFCGDLRARRDGVRADPRLQNVASNEHPDLAVTGFLSEEPVVEVEVFIDKIPVYNETLELEIAFTPFTECKSMWSEYKECGTSRCIKKQSFNDGVVNCPFLDCPDEDGCGIDLIVDDSLPPGLRTKVTLTAVTSIFCSFFLFLGCIWCCRYFELLCWSANTLLGRGRPHPVELSPMTSQPTAPLAPSPTQGKDLPPAYETLFPDR